MSANNTESAVPASQKEDMSCKVFVGNMTYQTRDSELKDIFAKAGTVVDARIVFRGPRSLGYGFVTMSSPSEVEKAVSTLKDYEFDGRKLNVEKAVPQEDRPARSETSSFRGRGGFRGGRGRGSFRGGARTRRPRPEGPPSKTVIFVGNLPYKVVDDDLVNIFSEFNVVKAHVVRRANGTSKGFGFVTVATEADQANALTNLINVECDERPLIIRAAVSEEGFEKKEEDETA